jgi:FAD synthetase
MKKVKVMVFGTFDLLHPGHINFFQQAKKLVTRRRQGFGERGNFLIVSVGRDENIKKFKGFLPVHNQRTRLNNIRKLSIVNKAVLASLKNPWSHILREKPDIIALGYDQKIYVDKGGLNHFRMLLQKKNIDCQVVRLKSFKPKIYKSSIIKTTHYNTT